MTNSIDCLKNLDFLGSLHSKFPEQQTFVCFAFDLTNGYQNTPESHLTLLPDMAESPRSLLGLTSLGIKIFANHFFSSIPQAEAELTKKMDWAFARKKIDSYPCLLSCWQTYSKIFLIDLLGAIVLGGSAALVYFKEWETADLIENKVFAKYLRCRVYAQALKKLHVPSDETQAFCEELNTQAFQRVLTIWKKEDAFVNLTEITKIFDFAISYTLQADLRSLEGLSLEDLYRLQSKAAPIENWVKIALYSCESTLHIPNINAFHILSGTINASVRNPAAADSFFDKMVSSLDCLAQQVVFQPACTPPLHLDELLDWLQTHADRNIREEAAKHDKNPLDILKGIKLLKVINHQLTSLPRDFPLLTNLCVLDLSSNHFEEIPEVIFSLKFLKTLIFRGNHLTKLSKDVAEKINNMPLLNNLDILQNPIQTIHPLLREKLPSDLDRPFQSSWEVEPA